MSFRTLEITNPTEIHIKNNQLELTQENRQIYIPIEDLSMITTIGSNIRLSTMDLSILANNHVSLRLTEKQYANITYLTGCPDEQEKIVGTNCHIML